MALSKTVRQKLEEWYRDANWTNPEHYPALNASYDRWAWEFLRRNDEFKKEFAGVHESSAKEKKRVQKKLCERWGIALVYLHGWIEENPGKYDSPCLFQTSIADCIIATYHLNKDDEREFHIVPHVENEFLYRVNLMWPIEPQIQAIKRHSIANQKMREQNNRAKPVTQVRRHVNKFPAYLRAFDAFKAGANAEQIASQFSKEKLKIDDTDYVKAAYNAEVAARRLINGEYRFIPFKKFSK